jgi:hypothetical protein
MTQTIEGMSVHETQSQLDSPASAAGEILRFATRFCHSRMCQDRDPLTLLKNNDPQAHDYFRHGLSLKLGEYLGAVDPTIKAVYTCNWDDTSEDAEPCPACVTTPVSVMIWTSRKTAALDSIVEELEGILTRGYAKLVAPRAEKLTSLLDIHVVDDHDVVDRVSYAALLQSTSNRATKVWARD